MSTLLLHARVPTWSDSMAALAGKWCRHEAAPGQLLAVLAKLTPLGLLSSKQLANIKQCYTSLLVGLPAAPRHACIHMLQVCHLPVGIESIISFKCTPTAAWCKT